MPRLARAVLPGIAHHVTQRGVDRQDVFDSDESRTVYLRLALWSFELYGIRPLAYCLMSNHVHWVVVPLSSMALAKGFGALHGRYALHRNTAKARSGHFWQNRFFSCAMDEAHTWAAVRYVERNPVRAGLVESAEQWSWSSAPARLGFSVDSLNLDLASWRERFTVEEWRTLLASHELSEAEAKLRANTYTGRPAGEEAFVRGAELALKRKLEPQKGGRPRKSRPELTQGLLFAEAATR